MKQFLANMNVSQFVFLMLSLILAFQTVYLTIQWWDTPLFNDVLLVIVWYFYGKATNGKPDTLVEWNLDDNNKI